jgi:predicted nucleic acid-binding Zn ribbon protein
VRRPRRKLRIERSCRPSVEEYGLIVPVYVYRRQDGSTFEIEQRMSEESLISCPTTGQKVQRVLQPFSPRYKGTGFYSTDHRRPKATKQPKSGEE